jgi:hypothetical protein
MADATDAAGAPGAPGLTTQQIIESLRSTREGYEDETTYHRFLLDSYAGTGGFAGRVRQPFAGFWGAGAEMYSRTSMELSTIRSEADIDTYLDRHPREELPKFKKRMDVAHYPNYVEPIVDIRLSYLTRKPSTRIGFDRLFTIDTPKPEPVAPAQVDPKSKPQPVALPVPTTTAQRSPESKREHAWADDIGNGMTWDRYLRDVIYLRAALLGWTPVLINAPVSAPGLSVMQAKENGLRARAHALFPANLRDYALDDRGQWLWAKLATRVWRRPTPFSDSVCVERYEVWYPERVDVYEIAKDKDGRDILQNVRSHEHGFGRVPLVIFRAKPTPDDSVVGLSMVGSVAQESRRLFNYVSELDEHLRSSTFAFLQVPVKDTTKKSKWVLGSGNALPVPHDASQGYAWIAPGPEVAEVYEKRIATTVQEIHRMGRTEYTASGEAKTSSGVARAFSFENTNRAIADTARCYAEAEQEVLRIVSKYEGATDEEADDGRVTPPTKFDVEEMARELDDALKAVSLALPAAALAALKKRITRLLLPNLNEEEMQEIDDQIDAAEVEREQAAIEQEELDREAARAAMLGDEEGEPGDDDTKRKPPGASAGKPKPFAKKGKAGAKKAPPFGKGE